LATIKDVAAVAGVSIKTVSRVLNNEPHVRPQLVQKVREAVDKLSYLPNQSARRLAGSRSFLIAYIYDNPPPGYLAGIQKGASLRCRELGYHLVVEPLGSGSQDRFEALRRLVATLRPDGAFLIPPASDDQDLLEMLEKLNVATVRIAGTVQAHGSNLPTPERESAAMLTQHLLDLGHRKIAIIAPPRNHAAAFERLKGFRDAMQKAGATVRKDWVVTGRFDFDSGMKAAAKILASPELPTAIVATNDEMALGAMVAVRAKGLSVPDDISVVGFDDTPASASAWPPLTTVRQPLETMGRAVIDRLVSTGEEPDDSFKFSLVVRSSTTSPKP